MDNQSNGGYSSIDISKRSDLGRKLKQERNATAFEFRVLRSLVKDKQTRQDMLKVTHGNDLGSYTAFLKKRLDEIYYLENPYPQDYDTGWGDLGSDDEYWEDEWQKYLREAWTEWQKTEKYSAWLEEMNLSSDEDESELFYVWKNWVETTEYDFESDVKNVY